MNKQNAGWASFALLIVVILAILFWQKGCSGCGSLFSDKDSALRDSLIAKLSRDLDSCQGKNKKPEAKAGGISSYSYFYSVPAPKEAPSYKENPSPKETKSYNENPVKKDQTPTVKHGLGPMYFEGTDGKIYFCLNFSGNPAWFLPHLALVNGEQIFAQKNNQGGYNWVVSEDQLSDGFSGEWGVTRDGTFFVSCALVDRNNPGSDQLFILTTVTGWAPRPMQRSGSYYIFKP